MILLLMSNIGYSAEERRSKKTNYDTILRVGIYYYTYGCLICTNAVFNNCFTAIMILWAMPVPFSIIIGNNMSF